MLSSQSNQLLVFLNHYHPCRLPWDSWTSPLLPVCYTMKQMKSHRKIQQELVRAVETDLINMTGCAVPCSYMQFKHVGSKVKSETSFGFILRFAKTEVFEEKEAYVYGFVSFVSEFGGSLGLFLGFSFLTVWDIFEPLFISCAKQIRYIQK